nr:hypothetical protein [Tanacetum cinerariifolium]
FIAEVNPGLSAPNDSIPLQQGMDEGTKNTSYDHIFAEKGASSTAIHGDKEEAFSTIKLEDLAKLVSQMQPSFKDLDLPVDDLVIIVDESDEDEPNEEFLSLPAKVESAQAKLKTLDALSSLLLNVTKAMNKFAEVLESTSTNAGFFLKVGVTL